MLQWGVSQLVASTEGAIVVLLGLQGHRLKGKIILRLKSSSSSATGPSSLQAWGSGELRWHIVGTGAGPVCCLKSGILFVTCWSPQGWLEAHASSHVDLISLGLHQL